MIANYKASIAKIAVDKSQAGLNKDVDDAK